MMTRVSRRPPIVVLLNFAIKTFLKYSSPFFPVIIFLLKYPALRGMTTNSNTDKKSVL